MYSRRARFGSTYTKIGTIQRRLAWPCARMTRKFVKRSKFLTISFAEYQRVPHAQLLVISTTSAYVSGLCKRGPLSRSQSQVGDRTSKETKTEQTKKNNNSKTKRGKKGNNPGTRQEPLRIQVNNNFSKYCDSFHLWP